MTRSSNVLSDDERTVLSRSANRFLNLLAGTRVEYSRRTLGPKRTVLDDLRRRRLIRIIKGSFVPTLLGLDALQDRTFSIVQSTLGTVLFVLRQLYTASVDTSFFSFAGIVDGVPRAVPTLDAKDVLPALILGEELTYYNFPHGVEERDGYHFEVDGAMVAERILDLTSPDDIQHAIVGGVSGAASEALGQTALAHGTEGSGSIHAEVSSVRSNWQDVGRKLGEGGQSIVSLVRIPERAAARAASLASILDSNPWTIGMQGVHADRAARLADAVATYSRADFTAELGAMKEFKLAQADPDERSRARRRLAQEIAVLQLGLPGLPRLLGSNEAEGWVVVEFFSEGTLESHPHKYRGNPALALRAFRSLLQAVIPLHERGYVHRDIKRANIFVRDDDTLALGDFGIIFMPGADSRVTATNERVGPRDYMPEWGNLGARLENVRQSFDVYMLGKLLWSMVDGRAIVSRERHRDPDYDFDLTKNFADDPRMHIINKILDKCLVDKESKCLRNAQDLALVIDEALGIIERGGQLLSDGVPRPCRICGKGNYQPSTFGPKRSAGQADNAGYMTLNVPGVGVADKGSIAVSLTACDYCGHVAMFKIL